MPQIQTDTVVITFSKLVRTGATEDALVTEDILQALQQVAQELAGDSIIVEVERA